MQAILKDSFEPASKLADYPQGEPGRRGRRPLQKGQFIKGRRRDDVVKLYLIKIHRGEMTIDDVPALWRAEVAAELEKEGK